MSSAGQQLEQAIDKILQKTENEILADLQGAGSEAKQKLDDSISMLNEEYDKIIADGQKEAAKLEKQVVGSADLDARNKQLLLLEDAVDRVFARALDQITETERSSSNKEYAALIKKLVEESIRMLGTDQMTVTTNAKDADLVGTVLADFPGAELSPDRMECIGGIAARSRDGIMTFENTIDARIQRLKPLIRKEIASKFGVGDQDGSS